MPTGFDSSIDDEGVTADASPVSRRDVFTRLSMLAPLSLTGQLTNPRRLFGGDRSTGGRSGYPIHVVIHPPRLDRPGYGYEYHFRTEQGRFLPGALFEPGKGCPGTSGAYENNPRPSECDEILEHGTYVKGSVFNVYEDDVWLLFGDITGGYVEFPDARTTEGDGISAVEIDGQRYTSMNEFADDYPRLKPDGSIREHGIDDEADPASGIDTTE